MVKLERALVMLGFAPTPYHLKQFEDYMEMVLDWNKKVNLTAIIDADDFIVKHFIDSVLCIGEDEFQSAQAIVDVGTGAGFPGIPLAILYPEKHFLLMDSLNKRIRILGEVIEKLGLKNVSLLHARAEDAGHRKGLRESFDLCVSRAVANLSTLSEYCLPFIKVGGYFLAYKGPDYEEELNNSRRAFTLLGGEVSEVRKAQLHDFGLDHNIIYIKKKSLTSSKYPRKAGTPSKEPLK